MGVERLIRKSVLKIEGYQPVEPLERLSTVAGRPSDQIIKLDGNENPYGTSPKVLEALGRYEHYHLYPDSLSSQLREMLAGYIGLSSEQILVGSGSDELIDLILRLLLEPGDRVVNCVPTFGMYAFSTAVCGGQTVAVPRGPGYEVDVEAVLAALDERTKVIFIASPNNPTGNVVPQKDVERLLASGRLVVVDEAYAEFSGHSVAEMVSGYESLVVLRTFSKWAGLAGLRVGYGLFPRELMEHLWKIKPPYNVNIAGQVAALAALEDRRFLQEIVRKIVAERERLWAGLRSVPYLKAWPSQGNFIFCQLLQGNAALLWQFLAERGIFVRYYDDPLLRNALRISVGKPEHTDALLATLREWRPSEA